LIRRLYAVFAVSAKGVPSLSSLLFFLLLAVALTFFLFDRPGAAIQFFQSPVSPAERPAPAPVDTDGDGIADNADACPNEAGKTNYNGCPPPDSDGDGLADEVDACPNEVGTASYNGCPPPAPDSDGDGVPDEMDACPNQAGTASYNGCPPPAPDSDGDGVADEVDACPNEAGTTSYNGCPSPQSPETVPPQEPLDNPLQPTEAPMPAPEVQPTRMPEVVVDQGLLIDTALVYAAYVWLCCGVTAFLTIPVFFLSLYAWGKRRLKRIEAQE
jgi:hypothetical protein